MKRKKWLLFFILCIPILFFISCQRSPISDVSPNRLDKDAIVFKGKAVFRDTKYPANDPKLYWVIGLTNNTIYQGNSTSSDTIWLDYEDTFHSWNFSKHNEYFVIAKPTKRNYEKFKTYEPNFVILSSQSKKEIFESEVSFWEKIAKKKRKGK